MADAIGKAWPEITRAFLKVVATASGGPAIMGVMQAEFQERRQWVSRPRFSEGLALVNLLPGATATQLGIFLGYARGGWWGGLLAGFCFAAPGFVIMLGLAVAYGAVGTTPAMRGALYGLGPVVLALFVAALVRLAGSSVRSAIHLAIALGAAALPMLTPLGAAATLLLAGGAGVFLFHRKGVGAIALAGIVTVIAVVSLIEWRALAPSLGGDPEPTLGGIAALFASVGALTFGGGITMVALMQELVVERLHWLTAREFVDGLALGQLTPGPVLMFAAYVGYKVLGVAGAVVAAGASFLPSFALMLGLLPLFERLRTVAWARAAMQGLVPAVIGVMAIALARIAPAAAPDGLAIAMFLVTTLITVRWRIAPLRAVVGGSLFGLLRDRLCGLPGVRAVLCHAAWGR